MKFSIPFFQKRTDKNGEYFFGLLLKEQEGVGIIMKRENKSIILKSYEKFNYSNGWENLTQDIDDLLFKIEHAQQIRLEKTIFFVFSHLLDEKTREIKKPYLLKIKDLVKNLELEAMGYIECYEAVIKNYSEREEMPLSAIILELDRSHVDLFIFKSGKSIYSKIISRTSVLVDDFIDAIDPIKKDFLLPARILLYDSYDLSEESTKFVSYRWSEDYFVQMPRITIIKESELIEGLVKIFNYQINKEEANNIIEAEGSEYEEKEIMGFAIGKDILKDENKNDNEFSSQTTIESETFNFTEKLIEKPKFVFPKLFVNFSLFKPLIEKIKSIFPKNKISISPLFFIVMGIVIIMASLFSAEIFLHKARLTVYYPVELKEKKIELIAGIDDLESSLPITIATVSAEVSESKQTTGKRDIGDKSSGEITIHSFDDKEKIFNKGTLIKTGNLQFILNSDIKVASASLAADGSAKLPGKTTAKVTAVEIGTEGNIDKGQRFSFNDLSPSTYFAINEKSFSGGSKRQVQTVSKKDIEDLTSVLLNKAKNNKELVRQSSPKERIISSLTSIILKDSQTSKEVGEESNSVTLKGNAVATYYTYDEDKMIFYIISAFKNEIKSGYTIKKENIQYQISSAKLLKNSLELQIYAKLKAVKDVSPKEVINLVKGRRVTSMENIIKNNLHADGYKLNLYQTIPPFSLFLPFFEKNINLEISSL